MRTRLIYVRWTGLLALFARRKGQATQLRRLELRALSFLADRKNLRLIRDSRVVIPTAFTRG